MRAVSFIAPLGLLCLASHTLAQDSASSSSSSSATSASSTAATAPATSTLIPSGISSACSEFLSSLNTDTNIQACTTPLLQATTYYTNATQSAASQKTGTTSETTVSAQTLTDSLDKLCDGNTGCQPQLIRTQLSKFWTACSAELRAKNEAVLNVYDVMYLLNPFQDAVCTKDTSNNYCLLSIANSSAADAATTATTSKRSLLTQDERLLAGSDGAALHRRQASTQAAEAATAGNNKNIAFLFLQPDSDKTVLCSQCSKNILAAYIKFETSIPYAIGLSNSQNLAGQSDLYKAMGTECGDDATTNVNELAGTTAFAAIRSGASALTSPASAGLAVALGAALATVLLL